MSTRPATSTAPDRSDPRVSCGLEQAVVCVLSGGRSSEREVSLTSGARVAEALRTPVGDDDRRGPARVRPVEVLPSGRWRVGKHDLSPGAALDSLGDVDVFFSALHGGEGENGALQGLLTCCGRAFTGSGVCASAVGMDKVFTRELLQGAGASVARGTSLSAGRWRRDRALVLAELDTWSRPGWAVKPRGGGSSVGATMVSRAAELADALDAAFAWEDQVLVETRIDGVEVTGGVLESPTEGTLALPVVEIRPRAGRFFDYREKYSEDGAIELCPQASLDQALESRVRELSLLAHRILSCGGYSRSDFIVPRDARGALGEPVFLELNTLPGMTPRSLLPRAAAVAGIDYRTLCLWIASEGMQRRVSR